MASSTAYFLIIITVACATSDEIDIEMSSGNVVKFLRAMTNQTQGADTLNLPANASSIRENITDTFSCENRTYGYYADVDNDCQVFHVCLPSQTPSGRNVTYRWSFICPSETVFNQEVLVCTRPRDALPCEDSPMYYDINMEFGRVTNDTKKEDPNKEMPNEPMKPEPVKENKVKRNRKPVRKQNIIVQNLLQEVVEEEMKKVEELGFDGLDETPEEIVPVLVDNDNVQNIQEIDGELSDTYVDQESRFIEERSMPWTGRNIRRGGFRFKADV